MKGVNLASYDKMNSASEPSTTRGGIASRVIFLVPSGNVDVEREVE